jgi:hypothetical protein
MILIINSNYYPDSINWYLFVVVMWGVFF